MKWEELKVGDLISYTQKPGPQPRESVMELITSFCLEKGKVSAKTFLMPQSHTWRIYESEFEGIVQGLPEPMYVENFKVIRNGKVIFDADAEVLDWHGEF